MIENIVPINEKDKIAEKAWSELVIRSAGTFANNSDKYIIGGIKGENGVHADLRLHKISKYQGGEGYFIYVNDITSSYRYNRGGISEESILKSEVDTIVMLVNNLREKGVDIKRVSFQAAGGADKRLESRVNQEINN